MDPQERNQEFCLQCKVDSWNTWCSVGNGKHYIHAKIIVWSAHGAEVIRKIRSVKTKMCMIMTVNQECATIRTRIEKRDPSLCIENRLLVTHGVSCSHSRTTVAKMPLTRMIFPMNELRRTSSSSFKAWAANISVYYKGTRRKHSFLIKLMMLSQLPAFTQQTRSQNRQRNILQPALDLPDQTWPYSICHYSLKVLRPCESRGIALRYDEIEVCGDWRKQTRRQECVIQRANSICEPWE